METENQMLKHGRSANHNEQKWNFFFFAKTRTLILKKIAKTVKQKILMPS